MAKLTARGFPHLTSKRLLLRAPAPSDAEAFRAILSIQEVTRFSNWPEAPTKTQGERYMRWMAKLHASGDGCAWMIEHRRSGALIGAVRFNRFDKKWRNGEIGYELHPDHWGQGYLTEAVRLVVDCGHAYFKLNRIEAWTLPGNVASDRVLEKCGFQFEGVLRQRAWFKGSFHDFRMFARLAGDT